MTVILCVVCAALITVDVKFNSCVMCHYGHFNCNAIGVLIMSFEAIIEVLKFFLAVTLFQLVHSLSNAFTILCTLEIIW